MKKMKFILVVLMLGVFMGCGSKQSEKVKGSAVNETERGGLLISVAKASISNIEDRISLTGVVVPFEQINVYSKTSGKLLKYAVEEGDMVKKDTVIAYVDRDEPGFEFSPSPVKSPMAGIVLKKYVDVGATVSPAVQSVSMATPIVTVGNIDKVKVQVTIIEQDLSRVKENQYAEINIEAYKDKIFKGEVYRISPIADLISHTAKVEILVDNKDKIIKPGVSADVEIVVGKHDNVVVIPREILIRKQNEEFVYIIYNGMILKRIVKKGYDDGKFLEIQEGLKEGEIIAASDFNVLKEGLKVKEKGE